MEGAKITAPVAGDGLVRKTPQREMSFHSSGVQTAYYFSLIRTTAWCCIIPETNDELNNNNSWGKVKEYQEIAHQASYS